MIHNRSRYQAVFHGGLGSLHSTAATLLISLSLSIVLAACGGGQGESLGAEQASGRSDAASADSTTQAGRNGLAPSFLPATNAAPSAETIATQQDGARLNSEELAQIAKTGVLPKAFPGKLLSGSEEAKSVSGGTPKSAASRVPTYRFFNTRTSAHFFTTSETEKTNVQATLPFMSFEGPAFHASSTAVPGLSPVHRFYNTQTGVHFYTVSEAERAHVAATLPQFNYEGVAYHASTLPGTGYTPLYRFFYASKGFHFYTNSAVEKDNIIATLPQYSFEGIGYYVLGGDWQTPAIPHTGITSTQCYVAGSDALATCTPTLQQILNGGTSLDLNPQQDGHRRNINPMTYSVVGANPKTSCVKDDVTGLIWEGKEAEGVRAGTNTYTYFGDGREGDVGGYVTAVRLLNLCGYSDWRIPTAEELHGLVHFGGGPGAGARPLITIADFPNTQALRYWTSSPGIPSQGGARNNTVIDFATGSQNSAPSAAQPVRLVRGARWSGTRYLIATAPYSGDGPDNAVVDRVTGLTWRRCLESLTWNGSACTGSYAGGTPYLAAAQLARNAPGWRLPNIKEVGSLIDPSQLDALEGAGIDLNAFPSAYARIWSSTPNVFNPAQAWMTYFTLGVTVPDSRADAILGTRLVRIEP